MTGCTVEVRVLICARSSPEPGGSPVETERFRFSLLRWCVVRFGGLQYVVNSLIQQSHRQLVRLQEVVSCVVRCLGQVIGQCEREASASQVNVEIVIKFFLFCSVALTSGLLDKSRWQFWGRPGLQCSCHSGSTVPSTTIRHGLLERRSVLDLRRASDVAFGTGRHDSPRTKCLTARAIAAHRDICNLVRCICAGTKSSSSANRGHRGDCLLYAGHGIACWRSRIRVLWRSIVPRFQPRAIPQLLVGEYCGEGNFLKGQVAVFEAFSSSLLLWKRCTVSWCGLEETTDCADETKRDEIRKSVCPSL